MRDGRTLQEVIRGCIQAERASQKTFYQMFYGFGMAISMRYCSDKDDAVEIVNDGFLKIFRQLNNFRADQHFEVSLKGWMKKIFINTAIDHYRKNQSKVTGDEIREELLDNAEQINALDKLSYNEIIALIQHLSPVYRTVFNLYVIDGYRHEEIARYLGITIGTSKSNLFKARMNIQQMIKKSAMLCYERKVI